VTATDRVGNVSGWMESGPVVVQGVTKYYAFGGKPVALRQGTGTAGPLTYLSRNPLWSVRLADGAAGAEAKASNSLF